MRNILSLTILITFWASSSVAQTTDFYDSLLIPEEIKQMEAEQEKLENERNRIQSDAGKLLDSKPKVLKIDNPNLKVPTSTQNSTPATDTSLGEAPFGLIWASSVKSVKAQGASLRAVESMTDKNSYEATLLPKPIKEFSKVVISFGDDDKLWRVIAYSDPSYDDDNASKGLFTYKKYVSLLKLKYGNAMEFFVPKVNKVETTETDSRGQPIIKITEEDSRIGDRNFLNDLKNEEVTLYSTFEDQGVGTSITLRADEDGKSYIIIEYKNSEIIKEQYMKTLNSL
jgi:hypothetical protein